MKNATKHARHPQPAKYNRDYIIMQYAPQAFFSTLGRPFTKEQYGNWRKECAEKNLDVDHVGGKVRAAYIQNKIRIIVYRIFRARNF